MKILSKGALPENIEYYGKCSNCHTDFIFQAKEAKWNPATRSFEEGFFTIYCPLCNKQVVVYQNQKYIPFTEK